MPWFEFAVSMGLLFDWRVGSIVCAYGILGGIGVWVVYVVVLFGGALWVSCGLLLFTRIIH